ncbi:MAG: hypothetical protein WD600_01580, partial [Pseudohongiella sp.]
MTTRQNLVNATLTLALTMACGQAMAQDDLPRTPNGKPDLQGVWSNATLTPLTRDRELGETLVLNADQVRAMEGGHQEFLEAEYAASDPDREPGAGAQGGDDGDTNDGYNEFWKEVGDRIQVINGEPRS